MDAAREVLERYPQFANDGNRDSVQQNYARMYDRVGRDRFLLYARLREPRDEIERAAVSGLPIEQVREMIRKHVSRPVDEAMLKAFYDGLYAKLISFSHFVMFLTSQCQQFRPGATWYWDRRLQADLKARIPTKSDMYIEEMANS
jgi:hypothetical protein